MKKIKVLLSILLVSVLALAGCQTKEQADVVTTSFVSYDVARAIAGDELVIKNIIPWGSELHDFDPTPQDMTMISQAEMFIYTSDDIETWASSTESKHAVNLSTAANLDGGSAHEHAAHDHEGHNDDEHGHEAHEHGAHFWTDPMIYTEMIEHTLDEMIAVFPEHKDVFIKNAHAYTDELASLDKELTSYLSTKKDKTVFFAGHNALDSFAGHYNITITSLQDSYRPNADVTAKEITKLRDEMKAHDSKVLFHEELVEPLVAKQIQKDLSGQGYDIELLELNAYHNLSQKEFDEGVRYSDIFKQNIENIKQSIQH